MNQMKLPLQQIIKALKSGVAPGMGVEYLCVGRDAEIAELQDSLNFVSQGNGSTKFICGDYGTGKTFLLQRMKLEALRKNFVVSSVKINQGFTFNQLQPIYYHILHNLSILERGETQTSFEDLFDRWIAKIRELPNQQASDEINHMLSSVGKYNESFARAMTAYIRARISGDFQLTAAIASWITGEENIPYQLKAKFNVIGNVDKINAIDFFKAFIKLIHMLGYGGIIVLVDELELVMNERIDIRHKSYEIIRYFIDDCATGELKNVMFVFAATNDLLNDPQKGISSYEALSQRLGDPADQKNSLLLDKRQPVLRLTKPSFDDLSKVTNKIYKIYEELFGLKPQISIESIMNWTLCMYKEKEPEMRGLNIRKYIMKLVEVLDIMEQHPDNAIFRTELKRIEKNNNITFQNINRIS